MRSIRTRCITVQKHARGLRGAWLEPGTCLTRVLRVVVLDDGRLWRRRPGAAGTGTTVAGPASEAAPARPEDEREQESENADDQQDHADGLDVHARDVSRHRPGQDRACGDEEETEADSHGSFLSSKDAPGVPLPRGGKTYG